MEIGRHKIYVDYLKNKTYPLGYTADEKKKLRGGVESFFLKDDGKLYHLRDNMYLDDPERRRTEAQTVIVGDVEKELIIREAHGGTLSGGHFGQTKTIAKVAERFWWPGFSKDIIKHVQECDRCQKSNPIHKPPPSVLHPIPVNNQFGYRWCVDLIGPLKETTSCNKYVAVATEYLSRFPVAKAIPNKRADTVGQFIFEDIVCMFGPMRILQHDQGREFCNGFLSLMTEKLGIKDVVSTAYHPQTNGLTERKLTSR